MTESPREEAVDSNIQHEGKHLGWWWGVWQGERLVGFGASYKDKRRAFRHWRACLDLASKGEMPTVKCTNPEIRTHQQRIRTSS